MVPNKNLVSIENIWPKDAPDLENIPKYIEKYQKPKES